MGVRVNIFIEVIRVALMCEMIVRPTTESAPNSEQATSSTIFSYPATTKCLVRRGRISCLIALFVSLSLGLLYAYKDCVAQATSTRL